MYHTEFPRFFVALVAEGGAWWFHIAEIIDWREPDGSTVPDEVFDNICTEMASGLDKYINYCAANKIHLKILADEN